MCSLFLFVMWGDMNENRKISIQQYRLTASWVMSSWGEIQHVRVNQVANRTMQVNKGLKLWKFLWNRWNFCKYEEWMRKSLLFLFQVPVWEIIHCAWNLSTEEWEMSLCSSKKGKEWERNRPAQSQNSVELKPSKCYEKTSWSVSSWLWKTWSNFNTI